MAIVFFLQTLLGCLYDFVRIRYCPSSPNSTTGTHIFGAGVLFLFLIYFFLQEIIFRQFNSTIFISFVITIFISFVKNVLCLQTSWSAQVSYAFSGSLLHCSRKSPALKIWRSLSIKKWNEISEIKLFPALVFVV